MRQIILPLALLALSCTKKPQKQEPDEPARASYQQAVDRLPRFLKNGWVVSREGAETRHEGDSLIWSGMAMGALPPADLIPLETALAQSINESGGQLWRFQPLPVRYVADPASMDGALGLYWGLAQRIGAGQRISEDMIMAIARHLRFVDIHTGRLNLGSAARLELDFDYVLSLLAWRMLLGPQPSDDRRRGLETEVVAWAVAAKAGRRACFRIHLGWVAFSAIEALGGQITPVARETFCQTTQDLGLPTVDQWCARDGLGAFLDDFQYNAWEMRHQRCSAWETPDGNGLQTAAVDFLVGWKQFYK